MTSPPFPMAAIAAVRDAVRAELRIAGTGEDGTIDRHAAAALALCEAFTGQALIVREWVQPLGDVRGWQLLGPMPVVAIQALARIAGDGSQASLAPAQYAVDIDAGGRGWVRIAPPADAGRFVVTLTAGLAAHWADVPAPIAQGVTRMAAHLLEARDGAAPPAAVAALWRPWRRMRLAREART